MQHSLPQEVQGLKINIPAIQLDRLIRINRVVDSNQKGAKLLHNKKAESLLACGEVVCCIYILHGVRHNNRVNRIYLSSTKIRTLVLQEACGEVRLPSRILRNSSDSLGCRRLFAQRCSTMARSAPTVRSLVAYMESKRHRCEEHVGQREYRHPIRTTSRLGPPRPWFNRWLFQDGFLSKQQHITTKAGQSDHHG